MEPLIIAEVKKHRNTPNIILDKGNNKFEITGNSMPENVIDFYQPIYKWFEEYIRQPNPKTKLVLKPVYFNTSSLKSILVIFGIVEKLILQGAELEIEWQYHEEDEELLDTGKEFQIITKLPFTFVSYND